MPRRGENIYKRKDNRWEGRYIKGYDCSGKTVFGYVYAKSYKEVKEKLVLAKNKQEKAPKTNKKTLESFCYDWLTLSRNRVKESTYVQYRNVINKHILPMLGHYLPQYLSTIIVEEFANDLLIKGLSAKTVKDVLAILRAVLRYSYKEMKMPYMDIDVIYPKESKKDMRVLDRDEQKRLVNYLMKDMDNVKFGILLTLQTGLRIGELCALKWDDFSFEERLIHINSTMQRIQERDAGKSAKTKVIITDTKSLSSNRIIPMTDILLELCERLKDAGTGYVLTGRTDKYMEPRTLQYRFKKYTEDCGLKGVHFHTLRHTFATRCVEVGFEIKSLSEILGHSSTKVTLDRYVHSSLELKRANMKKLAAMGL